MSLGTKIFLIIALVVLVAWEVYVEFFASLAVLKLIAVYNVDKLLHVLGGMFIAGVILFLPVRFSFGRVVLLLLFGSVTWEIFELLLDIDVFNFFDTHRERWIKDTVGDIIVTVFGGLVYWKIISARSRAEFKNR